jgi:hypothetical protein
MASWKKVLVSGSSIEIASITSSATPSVSTLSGYNVMMIDNTGKVTQITTGNFNAGLNTGSYSFTASAVTGTPFVIGDGAILRVSGSSGLTTAISTAGSTTTIDVSANVGNGLQVVSNNLTLNTGSTHFIAGVDNEVFKTANFVDSSEIDFTVTAGTSVTAALINGSIANARLANSTISGIALGSNLSSHSAGSGLAGTAYNGSAAQTWTVDSGSMLAYYSSSIFSRVSGDITISSAGVSAIGSSKVTNAMLVNSSLYITAGAGLTGDASTALGATASLAVGAGTGITVNANDVALKNAGSLTSNLVPRWDSANGQFINSAISDDGSSLSLGRNTGVTGWLYATGAITGSAISSSGALTGLTVSSGTTVTAGTNIFAPSGYLTVGSPGGAPNSIGAVQGVIGFFSSNVTVAGDLNVTTNANITGNTTITGNLTVNGTTTTINTDNLLVEDKFALFASGSTSATDGGIVVQASAGAGTATGFALGYNATADRWAYQDALAFNATAFGTPTAYAVTAETAAGAPAANPAYGGATYGYGNVYVNS